MNAKSLSTKVICPAETFVKIKDLKAFVQLKLICKLKASHNIHFSKKAFKKIEINFHELSQATKNETEIKSSFYNLSVSPTVDFLNVRFSKNKSKRLKAINAKSTKLNQNLFSKNVCFKFFKSSPNTVKKQKTKVTHNVGRLGEELEFEKRQPELLMSKDKQFMVYFFAQFLTSSRNKR